MECNLRFLLLRPQNKEEELELFTGWIGWNDEIPAGLGDYLGGRGKLIQALRENAKQVFQQSTNWVHEYLIPLFIVAFGLLRFAPQLGNQQAAVQTVLRLAEYLNQHLPPHEAESQPTGRSPKRASKRTTERREE